MHLEFRKYIFLEVRDIRIKINSKSQNVLEKKTRLKVLRRIKDNILLNNL